MTHQCHYQASTPQTKNSMKKRYLCTCIYWCINFYWCIINKNKIWKIYIQWNIIQLQEKTKLHNLLLWGWNCKTLQNSINQMEKVTYINNFSHMWDIKKYGWGISKGIVFKTGQQNWVYHDNEIGAKINVEARVNEKDL